MQINRTYKFVILTQLIFLFGCEYYEHSNPLDPGYKGTIKKNLRIHSSYISDPIGNNLPYSGGNADSVINRGEKLKVFIKLVNLGNSIESNITATPELLSNTNIQIVDYYLKYGDILPTQISEGDGNFNYGSHAFVELQLDKSVAPNTFFSVILNYVQRSDTVKLICKETGASIINNGVEVTFISPSGNKYFFRTRYKIKNIGSSLTRQIKIIGYSSTDPNISFSNSSEVEMGDIGIGEEKTSGIYAPEIVVPNSLNFPYNTSVSIKLEDLFGNTWTLDYNVTLVR